MAEVGRGLLGVPPAAVVEGGPAEAREARDLTDCVSDMAEARGVLRDRRVPREAPKLCRCANSTDLGFSCGRKVQFFSSSSCLRLRSSSSRAALAGARWYKSVQASPRDDRATMRRVPGHSSGLKVGTSLAAWACCRSHARARMTLAVSYNRSLALAPSLLSCSAELFNVVTPRREMSFGLNVHSACSCFWRSSSAFALCASFFAMLRATRSSKVVGVLFSISRLRRFTWGRKVKDAASSWPGVLEEPPMERLPSLCCCSGCNALPEAARPCAKQEGARGTPRGKKGTA